MNKVLLLMPLMAMIMMVSFSMARRVIQKLLSVHLRVKKKAVVKK